MVVDAVDIVDVMEEIRVNEENKYEIATRKENRRLKKGCVPTVELGRPYIWVLSIVTLLGASETGV